MLTGLVLSAHRDTPARECVPTQPKLQIMKDLSKDELFRILSSARRRYIIYYLHRSGEEMDLKRLATLIAAKENGTSETEVTDEDRQRVYISLYQTHLPKLEEAGIINYDEDARLVTLTTEAKQNGFFWTTDDSRMWLRYYAALAALGWVLVFGRALGVFPSGLVSWFLIAVILSFALLALVVTQYTLTTTTSPSDSFETLIE